MLFYIHRWSSSVMIAYSKLVMFDLMNTCICLLLNRYESTSGFNAFDCKWSCLQDCQTDIVHISY